MEELQKENQTLKLEIQELKEILKKYTNPDRNKRYYERNREKLIIKAQENREKNKNKIKNDLCE